jgi:hypothetical protein
MSVMFDAHECTCEHPPTAHDDGFGCTERGCECLAGWRLDPNPYADPEHPFWGQYGTYGAPDSDQSEP